MVVGGSEIGKALNIAAETVRQYAVEGRIPFVTTPGGQRRYDLDDVKHALRMEKVQTFDPVEAGDEIRLSANPSEEAPIRRARSWRPSITAAFDDAHEDDHGADALRIPFIGEPGSSRFVVGQGARR